MKENRKILQDFSFENILEVLTSFKLQTWKND